MNRDFELENVSVKELYGFIQMVADEVSRFASIKNMRIVLSDPKPLFRNVSVRIEHDYLRKAFYELFINALKFSKPSTVVIVLFDIQSAGVEISVLNAPETIKEGVVGIPIEYENLVFEPFFRMAKIVFEEFETMDYGLGLTLVEKIVKKHGGKISISNILDSSNITKGSEIKVCASVFLPLAEDETVASADH
jgi:signal transduction histidine kinase